VDHGLHDWDHLHEHRASMSSTARGGKRSPADFYATPAWPVHRLLERLPLPAGLWLEPCAGEGAIIRAVNSFPGPGAFDPGDIRWTAHELREECKPKLYEAAGRLVTIGDFLAVKPPRTSSGPYYDVSISNYPFSIAMEMIEHNLKFASHVLSLLRLNFFGSEKRNAFFQREMPDVYVVPDRISFAVSVSCKSKTCEWAEIYALDHPLGINPPKTCPVCGTKTTISTTDSIEYAWFHWGPERGRRRGAIEVLAHTPNTGR
jgi:hypothetical protein